MTINMRLIATYHLVHSLTLFFGVMLPLIWLPVGLKVAAQTGQARSKKLIKARRPKKLKPVGRAMNKAMMKALKRLLRNHKMIKNE